MNIAVCDPLQESLKNVKALLERIPYAEKIELYSNIEFFFEDIREGKFYDAVLMELDWKNERNGIDLAQEIHQYNSCIRIIFMTCHAADYVENAVLETSNMSGFLLKPIKLQLLTKILEKIQ